MLKKFILICLFTIFLLPLINLNAQAPDITWTKTIGGPDSDAGRSVEQTDDGGYIIAGWTESFGAGASDAYLIRTDSLGDTLWTRTFGGINDDGGTSVRQTQDGGYILTGWTMPSIGYYDISLIKVNSDGSTNWTKNIDEDDYDYGYSVEQTDDGGYIITGLTMPYGTGWSSVYLVKTDTAGNSQWSSIFGTETNSDWGSSVEQTADGGYVVAGWTESYGSGEQDIYLIKTNASGDSAWAKTFGEAEQDWGSSVQQTIDGGYIISGWTWSYGADSSDVCLIKTDSLGNNVWTKTFGGFDDDWGPSVYQTDDGGYVVAGWTESFGADSSDVYIIKTDSSGDTVWTKIFGGIEADGGYSIKQTSDGGYIITGRTESYGAGQADVYLIKLESESGIKEDVINELSISTPEPNPFQDRTTLRYEVPGNTKIDIDVYNMLGQQVKELYSGYKSEGVYQMSWDGTDNLGKKVTDGIYFLKLKAGEKETTRKLVYIK